MLILAGSTHTPVACTLKGGRWEILGYRMSVVCSKNAKRSSASGGTAGLDVCLVPGPSPCSRTAGAREAYRRLEPGSSGGDGQK